MNVFSILQALDSNEDPPILTSIGTMLRQCTGIILLLCLVRASFDCHRPNQACQNGGTCPSGFSECACPEAFEGYDCGLRTADKGVGECEDSDPCTPGQGVCYNDTSGNGSQCYCNSDSYGNSCGEKRLSLECTEGRMVVNIYPYNFADFTGVVYIDGKLDVEDCVAQEIAQLNVSIARIPDMWLGLYIDISHTDKHCGNAVRVTNGSREEFRRTVIIQHSTHYISTLDEKFQLTCYLDNGSQAISSQAGKVVDNGISLKTLERQEPVMPVVLFIVLPSGDLLTNNTIVYVGSEIIFYFNMAREYASMRIETGEANNKRSDEYKKLTLIKDSCLEDAAFSVIQQAPYRDLKNESHLLIFKIRAFQFVNSDQVAFRFLLKICIDNNDGSCEPVDCGVDIDRGQGRRRRGATQETVVEATVKIQTSNNTQDDRGSWIEKRTVYLLAGSILLFLITVIATILVVRWSCERSKELNIMYADMRQTVL